MNPYVCTLADGASWPREINAINAQEAAEKYAENEGITKETQVHVTDSQGEKCNFLVRTSMAWNASIMD